jgi:hypothetical protein
MTIDLSKVGKLDRLGLKKRRIITRHWKVHPDAVALHRRNAKLRAILGPDAVPTGYGFGVAIRKPT